MSVITNFVQQQGFSADQTAACEARYPALMFQPRLIGVIVGIGLITQSYRLFLLLAVIVAWGALAPRWNLFDLLYHAVFTRPRGLPAPDPAPAPRRFAQGLAATFMLGIGLSLRGGQPLLAGILELLLVAALLALVFGRFCLGSYLYHLFTGKRAFANRTLPWKHS